MSRFTSPDPLGRYLPDGVNFVLHEPLPYEVGRKGSGHYIIVPQGFVTDFASIPRLLQWLIPKDRGRRAAILHDWLYASGGRHGRYGRYNRKGCDRVFLAAMQVLGLPWWTRWPMYLGVRLGGWVAWKNHRRRGRRPCFYFPRTDEPAQHL